MKILYTEHYHFGITEFNLSAEKILLCFPGLGSCGYDFEQLAAHMPDFRFIAVDNFGHGKTTSLSSDNYTVSVMLEAFAELLNGLNINQFCVLGHSYGGALAFMLTLHYKDKIRKCISIDGGYHNYPAIYDYVQNHPELDMLPKNEEEEARQTKEMIEQECYADMDEAVRHYREMIPAMSLENIKNMVIYKNGKYISHMNPQDGENVIHFMNRFPKYIAQQNFSDTDITILLSTLPEIMDELRTNHAENFQKISGCKIIRMENSYHAMHVLEPERIGKVLNEILSA